MSTAADSRLGATATATATGPAAIRLPASHLQRELFEAFDPHESDFGIAVVWRLTGPLDEAALATALAGLSDRHEALRTTLVQDDAALEQLIAPPGRATPLAVESVVLDDRRARRRFPRLLRQAAERPFDVAGGRLARVRLFRLGARDHVLLLDLHHTVVDGWSTRVLLRDFQAFYARALGEPAPPLGADPLQPGDYAAWERAHREPRLEAFWRARLARPPQPLRLPGERAGAAERPFDTAPLELDPLPASTMRALAAIGRGRDAGAGAIARAGVAAALAPYADGEVVVGVAHANRDRAELHPTVGLIVDFLPLHVVTADAPTFAELLRRTAAAWREVYAHRLPSGAIHALAPDAAGPRGGRPYDVTLNLTPHAPAPVYAVGERTPLTISEHVGREMRPVHPMRECTALARLAFVCAVDARGGLRSWIAPNNGALPAATVARIGRSFTAALRRASVDPFRPISLQPPA